MVFSKKKAVVIILLIIFLGAGLRFFDLAEEAFWTDEIVTISHLKKNSYNALMNSVRDKELTPPGYFIFLKLWSHLFGISEFSLRLPSVIFDTLSILLIYLIGSRLFNQNIAIIGSLIVATSMLQLVYAQEARPFALFGFLVLLSTILLLRFCRRSDTANLLIYASVTGIAFYISYMALFLMAGQIIFVIFYYKNQNIIKRCMPAVAASLLLMIPELHILMQQAILRQSALQTSFMIRGIPPVLAKLGIGFYLLPLSLVLITATFLAIIAYKLKNRYDYKNYLRLLLLIVLILFIICHMVFLETTLRSFSLIRHSFFIMPFFYLLIVKVLGEIKFKKIAVLFLTLILVFNGSTLYIYFDSTTKAPWDEAIRYIEERDDGLALVLFERSDSNLDLFNYYKKKEFRYLSLTWKEKKRVHQISPKELLEKLEREKDFWLISSRSIVTKNYYLDLLSKKYNLSSSKSYKELDLYYFNN